MPRPCCARVALAACGLLSAGCATTFSVPPGGTLRLAMTEYRLTPQSVRAVAGPMTIFVHNYGRLSHNLVISQDGVTDAQTRPIPPGQGTALYATLAPGRYLMESTVLSDQALGAYGTLTVTR